MAKRLPLKCFTVLDELLKMHLIAHDDGTCEYRDPIHWDDTRMAEAVTDKSGTEVSPGWVWGVRKREYGDVRRRGVLPLKALEKVLEGHQSDDEYAGRIEALEAWKEQVKAAAKSPTSMNSRISAIEATLEKLPSKHVTQNMNDRLSKLEKDSEDLMQLVFNLEKELERKAATTTLDAELRDHFDRLLDHLKMAHVTDARSLKVSTVVPIVATKR